MDKDFGMCADCDFKSKQDTCININSKHFGKDLPINGCDKIQSAYLEHTCKPKEGGDTLE